MGNQADQRAGIASDFESFLHASGYGESFEEQ
jgi:hypothetical protein